MPNYEVDYSYDIEEFATYVTMADNADEAENLANKYVSDTFPQAKNIQVDAVREVKA